MSSVAVVAHSRKSIGGGLDELRAVLARDGVSEPMWYEVDKSKRAAKYVRQALQQGADVVVVWGGDGVVQRAIDAIAGAPPRDRVPLAIVPAGTANLLADNLGVPHEIEPAVAVALYGDRRAIDVGVMNGEHFAVMGGTGFDALMIGDVNGRLKHRLRKLSYVLSGVKNVRVPRFEARVAVDGKRWFSGKASCVLVGNAGRIVGGIEVFPNAQLDDGRLEVGVVTARGAVQWARALGRAMFGDAARSPFVEATSARTIRIDLDRKLPYEIDGGTVSKAIRLKAKVAPHAVDVCVP
jgi:diacylglycerol kinase (ATP)